MSGHLPLSDMTTAQWMRRHGPLGIPAHGLSSLPIRGYYADFHRLVGHAGKSCVELYMQCLDVHFRTFPNFAPTYSAFPPRAQSMLPASSSLIPRFSSPRLVLRAASAATRCSCRTNQAAMASATDIPRVLSIQSHVVHGYVVGAWTGGE